MQELTYTLYGQAVSGLLPALVPQLMIALITNRPVSV